MLLPFLLLWAAIGAAIGFIASKFINLRGDAPIGGIGVGAAAAIAGGLSYNLFSGYGVSGWNATSCLFAAVCGGLAVAIWHLVRARYVSRAAFTTRRSY